jgi:hypothetical protein
VQLSRLRGSGVGERSRSNWAYPRPRRDFCRPRAGAAELTPKTSAPALTEGSGVGERSRSNWGVSSPGTRLLPPPSRWCTQPECAQDPVPARPGEPRQIAAVGGQKLAREPADDEAHGDSDRRIEIAVDPRDERQGKHHARPRHHAYERTGPGGRAGEHPESKQAAEHPHEQPHHLDEGVEQAADRGVDEHNRQRRAGQR